MARKKLTQEQKEARVKILAKAREKRFKENPQQYKNICPDVLSLPDDAPMSFAKVKQWIKTQKDIASESERASRRHGVETKIKFKEKSKALNARGYIRWLKYYLETGIFPGDFVGEYEDKPVHRRIIAGPREGCRLKGSLLVE